ncbi:MAG: UPF0179 family protein [Thermoproteus sp. AZ2]|jgi:uncharacterized protein (UPF0179 family)|uniref:UPF0179 family protein n=1 Tax=Thermoproteus sp. AZ2 TaxID=1609232 RepID=A0ACC6V0V8_9CREN|nr:MAG: hypothetical protein TU35_02175 [Thermoproteus sp. AZ2]
MGRTIITLISKEQAEVGHRFKVLAVPDDCLSCRLYSVCMGRLRPGRLYRVVEVRSSLGQRCKITGGEMAPVVVEELPLQVPIPKKKALEGVVITYEGECKGCEKCPEDSALSPGEKIRVEKLLGKVLCRGQEFVLAEVTPL